MTDLESIMSEINIDSSMAHEDVQGAMFSEMITKTKAFNSRYVTKRVDRDGFDMESFVEEHGFEAVCLHIDNTKGFNNKAVLYREDGAAKTTIMFSTYRVYGLSDKTSLNAYICSTDKDVLEDLSETVFNEFKYTEPPEDSPEISLWNASVHGPVDTRKRINCPEFDEIKGNYTESIVPSIEHIVKNKPTKDSGLILWTGEPGTGKTTMLRALIRDWSKWARIQVITDPESFFNDVNYVNSVVMNDEDSDPDGGSGTVKPLLLIAEDAGELISADARANTGQALSRLLNITDGLLGQGMSLYVLITTNEQITKLHPAARRKGRCISNIEFTDLTAEESLKWAEEHGVEAENRPHSLAELYALLEDVDYVPIEKEKKIGFAVE